MFINRVVLYIDDLDRCPPDRVVQVLQAVHLLLAFPLFVVVVGVDARWIAHSLRKRYPGLLVDRTPLDPPVAQNAARQEMDRQATPYDYLEKIFQIPLWLAQISDEGSKNMLDGLLRSSVVVDEPAPAEPTEDARQPEEESPPVDEGTPADSTRPPGTDISPASGNGAGHAGDTPPSFNPGTLKMREEELLAMQDLARILGRTPRAVKRFVNLYRLIRAGIEDEEELAVFLDSGEYRCVLLLLAVDTGKPEIVADLYEAVQNPAIETLKDLATRTPLDDIIPTWLGQMEPEQRQVWDQLRLYQFAKWISTVRRYSFHQEA